MKQKIIIISIILIIIFSAGMVFLSFSEIINKTEITEDAYLAFSNSEVNASITLENKGSSAVDLNVALIPFSEKPEELPIYFYYDESYPAIATSINAYVGVYNFLTSDLAEKRVQKKIELVNALSLADKMKAGKSIIIMASGVFPDTVYSPNNNLVTNWVKSGGILFWVGDGIGYYYGKRGMVIKDEVGHGKLGWGGQTKLLENNYINGEAFESISESQGDIETQVALALGLRYRFTKTGATLSDLATNNGVDIGFNRRITSQFGRSSISFISLGNGHLILFGSGVLEKQKDISWDITQIIASNLFFNDYPQVKYETINLPPSSKKSVDLEIIKNGVRGATLLIFNKNNEIKYFYSKVFNNNFSSKSNSSI